MKTLNELYNEIQANDELKNALVEAAKSGKHLDFFREHGVEVTEEELNAFVEAKANEDKPLSKEELLSAAGGQKREGSLDVVISILTGGIGCAIAATVSAAAGHNGIKEEGDALVLCNT